MKLATKKKENILWRFNFMANNFIIESAKGKELMCNVWMDTQAKQTPTTKIFNKSRQRKCLRLTAIMFYAF